MKKTFISIILFFSSSYLFAKGGDGAGNGGGSWVCRNINNSIRKIELVDFFEAKKQYKLNIQRYSYLMSEAAVLRQYKRIITDITTTLGMNLSPYFNSLDSKITLVDKETAIEFIDDALPKIKPGYQWCLLGTIQYEQLANFYTETVLYPAFLGAAKENILLSKELFEHKKFYKEERAGLLLHEIVYQYLRDNYGAKNSVLARRIVGIIASDLNTEEKKLELAAINGYLNFLKERSH